MTPATRLLLLIGSDSDGGAGGPETLVDESAVLVDEDATLVEE